MLGILPTSFPVYLLDLLGDVGLVGVPERRPASGRARPGEHGNLIVMFAKRKNYQYGESRMPDYWCLNTCN